MINKSWVIEQEYKVPRIDPNSVIKGILQKPIPNTEEFQTILDKMKTATTVEEQKAVWEELIDYVKNPPLDPNNCEEIEIFFFAPQEKDVDKNEEDV